MLNTIATVVGIVEGTLFSVSISLAFIPKIRAHLIRHAVMTLRETDVRTSE